MEAQSEAPWSRGVGSAEPAVAMEDTIELPLVVRLWRIAMRRRWIIIGSVFVVAALGLLWSLSQTPLYTATTQIEIAREGARITEIEGVERETSQFDLEFYQTQYGLLASNALAEQVVRNMRLYDNPQFIAAYGLDEAEPWEAEGSNTTPARAREAQIRRSVEIVLAAVEVAPIRSSRLVDVTVTTPDPALSVRIANSWGTNFIQMNLARRFEANSYARAFLEERLAQLRERLDSSERELVNYAAAQNIVNLSETVDAETGITVNQQSLQGAQLATLNEELARAEADRIRAQSLPRSGSSSAESLNSTALAQLRQSRAELSAEYAKLLTQFEPAYPPAAALRRQITELDRSIAREEARITSSLNNLAGAAGERESALRARVAALTDDMNDLRRRSIQYNIYQREVDTNRQLYDGLLQRYKEIGVAGRVGTNNILVVDTAQVPEAPSSPNHTLNLLASLLLGLIIGAVLAFIMEQIDEGITDPSDVARVLGSPLLGVVPQTDGGSPIEELKDLHSPIVESYIAVQTNLELSTTHGFPRSISVTSTRPQEGKSTTAYALASTLSRGGRRVVLIDGDMRSPSVHHEFGVENGMGLSNALAGNNDLTELLQRTSAENLQFMTAGPQPPNAADLLVGDRLSTIIKQLLTSFDHVIIDSPPVLGLADAPLIAAAVEGTIYTVEAKAIRTSRVRAAMGRLRSNSINLLGVVLSKFDVTHTQYSYAYDYQYRYGEPARKT